MVLEKDADPIWSLPVFRALLHRALAVGWHIATDAAMMLINEAPGCDLSARGERGPTPLMLATTRSLGVLKALVGKGVEVDAVDDRGWTAIVYAMCAKEEERALYLLKEAGALWRGTIQSARGMKGIVLERNCDRNPACREGGCAADACGGCGRGGLARLRRTRSGGSSNGGFITIGVIKSASGE